MVQGDAAVVPRPAIFLSYRREDAGGYAGRLYDALSQRYGQDRVFIDVDTLEAGRDFVEAIDQAVASSGVLIAVIGRHWATVTDDRGRRRLEHPEDFVGLEIRSALGRGIRVIPVLVGGAGLPSSPELPEGLAPLARRQAHELSDTRWRYDVEKLISVVDGALREAEGRETPGAPGSSVAEDGEPARQGGGPAAKFPTTREPALVRRRLPWVLATTLVFVAAAAIAVVWALGTREDPGAGRSSPFVGSWEATDTTDGSRMTLQISPLADGRFSVVLTDDRVTAVCSGESVRLTGEALRDGSRLQGRLEGPCSPSGTTFAVDQAFTYRPETDTLTDNVNPGTVWSRA